MKSKKKDKKSAKGGLAALLGKGLPPRPKDTRQAPPGGPPAMPMGKAAAPKKASIKGKKSKRSRNAGRS